MTGTQPTNFKQKFQDLRRLEKDLEGQKGRGLLLKELFAGQGWYLASLKQKLLGNRTENRPKAPPAPSAPIQPASDGLNSEVLSSGIPLEEIVPSEMDTTLSALEAFAVTHLVAPPVARETVTIKATNNATISVIAASQPTGNIICFNTHDASFEQISLKQLIDVGGDGGLDLLVIGSPEKESHSKAENNFTDEKWLLLGKMLKSMGLEGQRIAFSLGVDFDGQSKEIKHDRFYQEIRLLRPRLLLALGATACNMLLLRRERLSQVHGQMFTNTIKYSDDHELNCCFMPIYHPDFLLINPNMKRATWEDMKQAMLFLKAAQEH